MCIDVTDEVGWCTCIRNYLGVDLNITFLERGFINYDIRCYKIPMQNAQVAFGISINILLCYITALNYDLPTADK